MLGAVIMTLMNDAARYLRDGFGTDWLKNLTRDLHVTWQYICSILEI